MNRSTLATLALVAAVCAFLGNAATAGVFQMGSGLTSLELVTVGDPGNEGNPIGNPYRLGAVDYIFWIGKYEVTNAQYAVFLNAVARQDNGGAYSQNDPYDLYHNDMNIEFADGEYAASDGFENRPVNKVNWGDAARFINWLENDQPKGTLTGNWEDDAGLTEDGTYTLMGATTSAGLEGITRNSGAVYWLPNANEWYKAAYYNPADGKYWRYPVGDEIDTGRATYDLVPKYPTDVGSYIAYPSPYGTFDQGGNVWEWLEEDYVLGGSYESFAYELASDDPGHTVLGGRGTACFESGFRVAWTPEPGGIAALIGMAAVGFLWSWRRR